jgi:hypothetical protein
MVAPCDLIKIGMDRAEVERLLPSQKPTHAGYISPGWLTLVYPKSKLRIEYDPFHKVIQICDLTK